MTIPAGFNKQLRVAVANLEYGGLSETGDDSAWCKSMARLLEWAPHVLLVQEMNGRVPYRLHAHLWRAANELGMTPVLGPPSPDSVSGNHPAILVSTTAGLRVLDAGPPAFPAGATAPSWCEALVAVPGMAHPVWFISAHLPARSATAGRLQTERLANLTAARGGLVIAGGDWNNYAPDGQLTQLALEALPVHLRPARMLPGPGGSLEPDYSAHHALASVGLTDAAAAPDPSRRTPQDLTPTGITGGVRVDRICVTHTLIPALERYEQADTGGSDHHALLLIPSTEAAAGVPPPPPLP
jgi:hypothetical protein